MGSLRSFWSVILAVFLACYLCQRMLLFHSSGCFSVPSRALSAFWGVRGGEGVRFALPASTHSQPMVTAVSLHVSRVTQSVPRWKAWPCNACHCSVAALLQKEGLWDILPCFWQQQSKHPSSSPRLPLQRELGTCRSKSSCPKAGQVDYVPEASVALHGL